MKSLFTLVLSIAVSMWVSFARGQDFDSAASTIVQLSERSATLTEVSEEKYRQPLDAIRETLRERVAEAVAQREQLAADPENEALQAEFENTLSITFTELDRHMAALHEGRDEMLKAVDDNLEVIGKLRQELRETAQQQETRREETQRESDELDDQLQQAAERLGPLLASGEELPIEVDTLVEKITSDLQVKRQQAAITGSAVRQLRTGEENLRRFEQLLEARRADLEVAYHAIDGQRAVIANLVAYRQQRVRNQRLARQLGRFAHGISKLTEGIGEMNFSELGGITIDESDDAPTVDFGDRPRTSRGTAELRRRYQKSQTPDQVARQER